MPRAAAATVTTKTANNKILGIEIPPIENVITEIEIVGVTDFIAHKFSEKALKEIQDKQGGQPRSNKRAARRPEDECHDARYIDSQGKDCVRAIWFKKGMAEMAKYFGIPKHAVETSVWVEGDLIPIKFRGKKPVMRTDPVKIGRFPNKVTTLAYRPSYPDWSCRIRVGFDKNILSAQQVIALLAHAGAKNGIGEWRPQKNGDFGRFEVKPATRRGSGK